MSPVYDWALFLLPPVFALLLGIGISGTAVAENSFEFWDQEFTFDELAIGIFIHAHLVAVFFHSHGNPKIFRLHRLRFLLVPPLLYLAVVSSTWILVAFSVLATFWDVYHSALQTFGLARIYDRKKGNDVGAGRRLDWWLNQLLYAGPILAGVTMIDHFEDLMLFEEVGAAFFTVVPAFMEGNQRYFTWAVVAGGTAFLIYYVIAYWRLHTQGHRVSLHKAYLLASTGLCSIYCWGFNSWGEAFFIMNFFHALQYLALVWATEKRNMACLFRVEKLAFAAPLTLALFLGLTFAYGYWVQALDAGIHWLWAITIVVSIMHFWYDGFVWSVRRKLV